MVGAGTAGWKSRVVRRFSALRLPSKQAPTMTYVYYCLHTVMFGMSNQQAAFLE